LIGISELISIGYEYVIVSSAKQAANSESSYGRVRRQESVVSHSPALSSPPTPSQKQH